MDLKDNVYKNNSAISKSSDDNSGTGGAIYFECPNNNCIVKLI